MKTVTTEGGGTKKVKDEGQWNAGLRYRVRYADTEGVERSRSFPKLKEAEEFRDQVAADLRNSTYVDPKAGRITLRAYATEWLEHQAFDDVTRVSTQFRVRHILEGLGAKRLDQLAATPSVIQAWVRGLNLAPYTARMCFGTLSSILGAAVDDAKIRRNPCRARSIKLPALDQEKVVPLEADRLAGLRAALPARYRAMIEAGASCGLRQSEIFALDPAEHIDFDKRVVHVRRQVKIVNGKLTFALPKRGKTRDVPLPDSAALAFRRALADFPAAAVTLSWHQPKNRRHGKPVTAALMFTTPLSRGAISRHTFNNRYWKPALREAKIPDTRENGMHVLRHTYASMLLSNGADIRRVAACLGHTDPGFTLRVYGHLMESGDEQVRRAIDSAVTVPGTAYLHRVSG